MAPKPLGRRALLALPGFDRAVRRVEVAQELEPGHRLGDVLLPGPAAQRDADPARREVPVRGSVSRGPWGRRLEVELELASQSKHLICRLVLPFRTP